MADEVHAKHCLDFVEYGVETGSATATSAGGAGVALFGGKVLAGLAGASAAPVAIPLAITGAVGGLAYYGYRKLTQ